MGNMRSKTSGGTSVARDGPAPPTQLLKRSTNHHEENEIAAEEHHHDHANQQTERNDDLLSQVDMDVYRHIRSYVRFVPRDKEELKRAMDEWCEDVDKARSKYWDISRWDMRNITDMSGLFAHKMHFNDDITRWDVDQVTNMGYMFDGAHAFNQAIGGWDVSQVTNMSHMLPLMLLMGESRAPRDVPSPPSPPSSEEPVQ